LPHVHLPLQSGSDRVLESHGTGLHAREYLAKIDSVCARPTEHGVLFRLHRRLPRETESDFRETLSVMGQVRFDSSFSFPLSPRPGTRAAEMKERVEPQEAAKRLRRLQELQAAHTRERLAAQVGREVTVLVEGPSARDPGNALWANRLQQDGETSLPAAEMGRSDPSTLPAREPTPSSGREALRCLKRLQWPASRSTPFTKSPIVLLREPESG